MSFVERFRMVVRSALQAHDRRSPSAGEFEKEVTSNGKIDCRVAWEPRGQVAKARADSRGHAAARPTQASLQTPAALPPVRQGRHSFFVKVYSLPLRVTLTGTRPISTV